MNSKRNSIVVVVGIVLAVAAAGITTYFLVQDKSATRSMEAATENVDNESETYKKYDVLKEEDYDKAFLANMIVHHESAMNMAEMAISSAKRQDIKDLAFSISSSQGKEVSDMTTWQGRWGYPLTSGHNMTDMENASSSMADMSMMGSELKDLTGDAFDRKFLELMITHHQEAIDMSMPAETNAEHQEIKDLAKAIISTQSSEVDQMQRWQRGWGFEVTNGASSMSGMNH